MHLTLIFKIAAAMNLAIYVVVMYAGVYRLARWVDQKVQSYLLKAWNHLISTLDRQVDASFQDLRDYDPTRPTRPN